jgi:hypothetical protein
MRETQEEFYRVLEEDALNVIGKQRKNEFLKN